MKVDRYISERELLNKLNAWNMGLELPRWIKRAIQDTPGVKVLIEAEQEKEQ